MAFGAVITCDIVASTQLGKPALKKLVKEFELILAGRQYEFYRGDSFQVYVKKPDEALQVLLQLRTAALKIIAAATTPSSDVRAGIGIGPVKLPVKQLRTISDEAFVLSGRAFDNLKPPQRLSIAAPPSFDVANNGLQIVSEFVDYILLRMTVKQAAVVWELLANRTQKEAARRLKKTQATINSHAQAAGWPQLEKILLHYRQLTESLIL